MSEVGGASRSGLCHGGAAPVVEVLLGGPAVVWARARLKPPSQSPTESGRAMTAAAFVNFIMDSMDFTRDRVGGEGR